MKDHKSSIDNLQKALSMELSAVHQYLLHAHVLEDWGLDKLAARLRQEMKEELGHAGRLIDRILFLGGDPKVSEEKPPSKAESLETLFKSDLAEEKDAIGFYTDAARTAAESRDIGTRTLFERITMDEEGHMDWLGRQLDLLKRIGEPVYFAKHMSASADDQ